MLIVRTPELKAKLLIKGLNGSSLNSNVEKLIVCWFDFYSSQVFYLLYFPQNSLHYTLSSMSSFEFESALYFLLKIDATSYSIPQKALLETSLLFYVMLYFLMKITLLN